MKVNETCSCGATFHAAGVGARAAAATWRVMHPCKLKETPWPWPSDHDLVLNEGEIVLTQAEAESGFT